MFIFIYSGLLLAVLAVGAWYDIREQRIPNWLCAIACICGMYLIWQRAPAEGKMWPLILYGVRLLAVVAVWFPHDWSGRCEADGFDRRLPGF